VAIDTEDRVLLVRQYRHGYGGPTLELPSGVVDAADNGPVTAAARELMEETSYTAESLRLLASLSPYRATHTNRVHVVLAQSARHTGPATPEPSETIALVRGRSGRNGSRGRSGSCPARGALDDWAEGRQSALATLLYSVACSNRICCSAQFEDVALRICLRRAGNQLGVSYRP
jgi:ADP-ribose pyrophosphatase YjhB (NUDIX family)